VITGFPSRTSIGDDLCAETGPIYAAYTTGQTIVAAVCVSRDVSSGQVTVLAPCGACQERLALWGSDVESGGGPMSATGWSSKRLLELNPFYWPPHTHLITPGLRPPTTSVRRRT
jgi:cytidine deaminase